MKINLGSLEGLHHDKAGKLRYSRKHLHGFIDSGLLAGVKDDYQLPGFDTMLTDLLQNEKDYGIYPKVGKYSKIFNNGNIPKH